MTDANADIERRAHPRVQLPLVVELTHPSIEPIQTTARNISDGGVFVEVKDIKLRQGARVNVKLMAHSVTDNQPTPTVAMTVKRTEDDGVALAFKNRTAEHLWSSVERLRTELLIGRDYFQVYQAAFVTHPNRGLLFVQQHGKWMLPGTYLTVGEPCAPTLKEFLIATLGISLTEDPTPLATVAATMDALPESATLCVYYQCATEDLRPQLSKASTYKDVRWISSVNDLNEATIANAEIRELAQAHLESKMQSSD